MAFTRQEVAEYRLRARCRCLLRSAAASQTELLQERSIVCERRRRQVSVCGSERMNPRQCRTRPAFAESIRLRSERVEGAGADEERRT